MKRKLHLLFVTLVMVMVAHGAAVPPPYDNPAVYRINKVNPHSPVYPAESGEYIMLINGGWHAERFAMAQQAQRATQRDYRPRGAGRALEMPHLWPEDDSVTVVYRDVWLPQGWSGRNTVIRIGAVGSAVHLYVNGTMAGYSEDSYTPAEWDITRYMAGGSNRIALCIYGRSDASLIEPEGTPVGVMRDVVLYSVPKLHIIEYNLAASIDGMGNGLMDLTVDLSSEVRGGHRVEIELTDTAGGEGRSLMRRTVKMGARDWFACFGEGGNRIGRVEPWSVGRPRLYRLDIRLYSPSGTLIQSVSTPVGFRRLDRDDEGRWCLNGLPIQVRATLWDEPLPRVAPDSLRATVEAMRESGYNTIVLSRPASELFYDLCDEVGLMVWDRCAVDLHGEEAEVVANDEAYEEAIIYRAHNLMRRDRRHPCVVAWGVGGRIMGGYCGDQLARYMSSHDGQRLFLDRTNRMSGSLRLIDDHALLDLHIIGRYPHGQGFVVVADSVLTDSEYGAIWDTIGSYPALQGMVYGRWDRMTDDWRRHHLMVANRVAKAAPENDYIALCEVEERQEEVDDVEGTVVPIEKKERGRRGFLGWLRRVFFGR